jgi:superfamily I DNA and/or RNA helicase
VFDQTGYIGKKNLQLSYGLNSSQENAVQRGLGSDFTIIWGPPGTGKTLTLGALINEMVLSGKRVLVTSHTNIAVDTLMRNVVKHQKKGDGFDCVRYGFLTSVGKGYVPSLDDVLEDVLQKPGYKELYVDMKSFSFQVLGRVKKKLPVSVLFRLALQKAVSTRFEKEGKRIKEQIDGVIEEVLSTFDVVGTTITKLYCDTRLKPVRFDVIVIDEISMVFPAQVLYAAALVSDKVVLAGDFNQLPPIVKSNKNHVERLLKKSMFSVLSVDDEFKEFDVRPMLQVQYRMHPDISAVVNQLYYGGHMRTWEKIQRSVYSEITGSVVDKNSSALTIIDTSKTGVLSVKEGSNSRKNEGHAQLILSMLGQGTFGNEIGVITPYRGQRKLIKHLLYKYNKDLLERNIVTVNTIHAFQGQEKDVIILDLVDTPPVPSVFLNENRTKELDNLINVAVSRAKKQMILLVYFEHVQHYSRVITGLVNAIQRWGDYYQLAPGTDQVSVRFSHGWPVSKQRFNTKEIQEKIKPGSFVLWKNETLPVLKNRENEVQVNIRIRRENRKIWIPYNELEGIKNAGVTESFLQ